MKQENELTHYGILRRSGRYPWGSGGTELSRSRGFLGTVESLRKQGLTDTEIARGVGMTTTEFRAANSIARDIQKAADISMAVRLKEKGYSNVAIGERMGRNESSVRSLIAASQKENTDILKSTSRMLKNQVDTKGYIDIGTGVESQLHLSKERLATAVARLREEGYVVHKVQVDQLGTNNKTTIKVLAPAGTTYRDIASNLGSIRQINEHTDDGGRTWSGILPPISVDSKRVSIRYAEDGGAAADGVIFVRPGVADVSLGNSRYAQVRVAVNGTHYLKGMAMYKDDLPRGVDLEFNTNKANTGNKLDAMKPMKVDKDTGQIDKDDPFGSMISRQIGKIGENGKVTELTSAMNVVNEEGDWEKWKKSIASQVLSKQSPTLAKTQLDKTFSDKKSELDEIMSLTNPAVRRKLLETYSEGVDSDAVLLKAKALKGTASHVILPINSLKETEIYAPNYNNGERVALIRYPHGGTFEIPELTVNNKHAEAIKLIGPQARDAVGINSKVATRLSGADFDGDTVLVIPNGGGKIKSSPALEGLRGFDPQTQYKGYEGMKTMDARTKQIEMGKVSNLITDMTIRKASTQELAAAVRHSMVVIDAEKHGLNWKQSELDNGIANLKRKYQGSAKSGASTLISKATSEERVPERKRTFTIDPVTGQKVFRETGASYVQKTVNKRTGAVTEKVVFRTTKSTKLAETPDAHTLSSGTKIEKVYADHSNKLKALANTARREAVHTRSIPYSPSAREVYSKEVATLNAKLNVALKNRPLERQAQILAGELVKSKIRANPDMDPVELKKIKAKALAEYRVRTGAKKQQIEITEHEWTAIQSGAISHSKLKDILDNANLDQVKKLATPKTSLAVSPAKLARAQAMAAAGRTQAEIAEALGVGLSTLKKAING